MTSTLKPRFGFRVLGNAMSRRRLVDFNRALAGYCDCEPEAEVTREGYLSAFVYGTDFKKHLETTGSTKDYFGPCWTPWLWFDIDRQDDLDAALFDVRHLAAGILDRYRTLDESDLLLFFSGSKGFHVGLPFSWNPEPSATFHRIARRLAENLAVATGAIIDTGVYDKVRLFRAPNSRHPKTGLYKRHFSFKELLNLDIARIRQLAAEPEPFALPAVSVADPQALADWQEAARAVEREAEAKGKRQAGLANGTPTLNRATLDCICNGADIPQGDRHRRIFSAAANLAEFNCSPALAFALLTEAGLDSGLPPAEVRRQIECGLNHGRKGAGDALPFLHFGR